MAKLKRPGLKRGRKAKRHPRVTPPDRIPYQPGPFVLGVLQAIREGYPGKIALTRALRTIK